MQEELLCQARVDEAHVHGEHGTALPCSGKVFRHPLQQAVGNEVCLPGGKDNAEQRILEAEGRNGAHRHGNDHADKTAAQLVEVLPKGLRFRHG